MTVSVGKPIFDPAGFAKDAKAARDATKPTAEEDDRHLMSISVSTHALVVVGLVLAMRGGISFLAMLILGIYKYAKFAILAHHSLHGGWGRERRGWFASNQFRRIVHWLDWIFPQAWVAEHNKIHHYALNEDTDPDFVQRNLEPIRDADMPLALKYAVVVFFMATWKWFYYASNTLKLVHASYPGVPAKKVFDEPVTIKSLIADSVSGNPWYRALLMDFAFRVMLPPLALQFFAVPVLAGFLKGSSLFCFVTLVNLIGAEIVTNVWAFVTIVTNHAGADLWWFPTPCKADSPEFILRAVLGSTAYWAGNDVIDYLHGYLNYQGEHHSFPELSPLHYQRLHPAFKAVCAKHGVPYIQESVFLRTKKTMDIMVGKASHKRIEDGQAVDQPEKWMISAAK